MISAWRRETSLLATMSQPASRPKTIGAEPMVLLSAVGQTTRRRRLPQWPVLGARRTAPPSWPRRILTNCVLPLRRDRSPVIRGADLELSP
jgi:hypothetical protein